MTSNAPLKSVLDKNNCMECVVMQFILDESKTLGTNVEGKQYPIKVFRNTCMRCKKGSKGIYKYDAIRTALDLYEENKQLKNKLNKGKKATALKKYGTVVKNLRKDGKSIREIAQIVGISTNTVMKILNSINNEDNN